MANETLSASQSALIATQAIRDAIISAHLPKMWFLNHFAHDPMDDNSGTVRYPVESDLGEAASGTEGVDLTPTIELGMASSLEISPSEGVADMALITEQTVKRRLGGAAFATVADVFNSGNKDAIRRLLERDVSRMLERGLQKMIRDAVEMAFAAPSVQTGTTNTDLSITTILSTIRQMKILQPLRPQREWAFCWTSAGTLHLQTEALAASGGFNGTLWGGGQARFNMANAVDEANEQLGLIGDILNFPVYELDDEFKQLANGTTDVLGLMYCKSDSSRSPMSYNGKLPSFIMADEKPLDIRFEADGSLRAMECIMTANYGFGAVAANHVGILIDND